MNGLRPTNDSRGMQALVATSSRIPQDATTIMHYRRKQRRAPQGQPRTRNMPNRERRDHEKKGRIQEGKKVHTKIDPGNPQVRNRIKKNNKTGLGASGSGPRVFDDMY